MKVARPAHDSKALRAPGSRACLPRPAAPPGHGLRRRAVAGWAGALAVLGSLAPPAWAAPPAPATILVLGDSLSAEYGLARGTGWVALLERRLASRPNTRVINASISGETTSGGAARLPALLKEHRPTHVLIELGGNDALRGQSLKATQATLERMVQSAKAQGARVLLVGMMLPPNFGQRYARDFAAVYPAVAKANNVALVPFILAGVADRADARDWFQPDGIHPRVQAQPLMLDNVWKELSRML